MKDSPDGEVIAEPGLVEDVPAATTDRDYVNSLARGLEVISAFSRTKPQMTLSDMARSTGMTRATVRRLLLTLVKEGYAASDGKQFRLRPKVLRLGYSVLSSMNIWDVAQPIMNELSSKLQESCFAAVLDGQEVVYVARATSDRLVNIGISVGSRAPVHCVSTGRVLLAALPEKELQKTLDALEPHRYTANTTVSKVQLKSLIEETRLKGWSIVDQELEIGLRSLSVPIKTPEGDVVAALNICCPSARISPEDMVTRILAELMAASQSITAGLHH